MMMYREWRSSGVAGDGESDDDDDDDDLEDTDEDEGECWRTWRAGSCAATAAAAAEVTLDDDDDRLWLRDFTGRGGGMSRESSDDCRDASPL